MKKKILFMSDGIWSPTGFACVMRNLINGLKDEFDCAILSWQYIGNSIEVDNVKIYPVGKHQFGKDTFERAMKSFEPDILITYGDYWMVNYLGNETFQKMLKKYNTKWLWYCPVDSDIVPMQYEDVLKVPDKLIIPSRDGRRIVKSLDIECNYIPHGVDTSTFVPYDNKSEIKELEEYNDKFVIGCVARNQDRKQIPRLVRAFSLFAEDKDDVLLHLHCDPFDIANTIRDYDNTVYSLLYQSIHTCKIQDKVRFTKKLNSFIDGFDEKRMAYIYNLFDIHALSTTGEGFGIPVIESMACGVPNVMTNFTTAKELVEGRGELCRVQAKIFGTYGSNRALVDEEDMAKKFDKLYNDRALIQKYSKDCVSFAKDYDWKFVVQEWRELIDEAVC